MKILILSIAVVLLRQFAFAQCEIKSSYRSDGTTVQYFNAVPVGSGKNYDLGLSILFNGEAYFLNTTIRYFSSPKELVGALKIELENGNSLELDIYTSQIAQNKSDQVGLSLFYLTEQDILKLKVSDIKTIVFKESSNILQGVRVERNKTVLRSQIHCLQKQ